MKVFTAAFVALFLTGVDAQRTYVDDLGITHTTTKSKPLVVMSANTAVSFFDFGAYKLTKQALSLEPKDEQIV